MALPQQIIFYLSFFIVVAIFGFPRISMRKQPKLTSEEIATRYPNLQGIKYTYHILLVISLSTYFVLLIFTANTFAESAFNEYFIIFPFFLFLGLYDGLFALITGVFPATTRWNWNKFVYDEQKRYRWMAQVQIILAILATCISIAVAFFYHM